jgi:hypothetical protein
VRVPRDPDDVEAGRQSMPVHGSANHDRAVAAVEVHAEAPFQRAIAQSPNRDEDDAFALNVQPYNLFAGASRL